MKSSLCCIAAIANSRMLTQQILHEKLFLLFLARDSSGTYREAVKDQR